MTRDDVGARDRILADATVLFAERGYDGVSIADIAGAGGISNGLIYYHFKDKRSLYETVIRESVHLLEDAAVRTLGAVGRPIDRIRAFIAEDMMLLETRSDVMRLLVRSFTDTAGHVPEQVIARTSAIIDRVRVVIQEGIEADEFRPLNAHLAATALFALVNTLMAARVLNAPHEPWAETTPEEQVAFMTGVFLEGVAKCS
jgi:AcrR family transcriptional regulator